MENVLFRVVEEMQLAIDFVRKLTMCLRSFRLNVLPLSELLKSSVALLLPGARHKCQAQLISFHE